MAAKARLARRWFVRGNVQGVGFRYFAQKNASLLGLTGYVPSQDLAGEDRPETVAALIGEVYGWAGIVPDAP